MNIQETIKQIDKLKQKVKTDLVAQLSQIKAQDIVSVIQKRVRDNGKDSTGASFGKYSTTTMLTSGTTLKSRRVWRAVAASKKKRKNLNWVTIKKGGKNIRLFELKGGYAELRRLEGFSNAVKSFEFTGEMWRKFGIVRTTVTGNGIIFTLGGRTDASQNKIDRNSEREGRSIIDISQSELTFLQTQIDKILQGYVVNVKLN